jgi:AraC family transcriptional regulator
MHHGARPKVPVQDSALLPSVACLQSRVLIGKRATRVKTPAVACVTMNHRYSYSERVQRVVEYLAEHLDDRFDLEKLARLAHVSPYHFHRIYRALLGETAYETIRRLRLNRAALDLLDDKLSIERTAHRVGFACQAAFTRAFRAEYGTPPARYRGDHRAALGGGDEEVARYEVDVIDLPQLRVASIASSEQARRFRRVETS